MATPHPSRHTPNTLRGLPRSSAGRLCGTVRVAAPHPCRHTPHTFRGPERRNELRRRPLRQ
eukprot:2297311-Pyramimonas_sp.AAC.1